MRYSIFLLLLLVHNTGGAVHVIADANVNSFDEIGFNYVAYVGPLESYHEIYSIHEGDRDNGGPQPIVMHSEPPFANVFSSAGVAAHFPFKPLLKVGTWQYCSFLKEGSVFRSDSDPDLNALDSDCIVVCYDPCENC